MTYEEQVKEYRKDNGELAVFVGLATFVSSFLLASLFIERFEILQQGNAVSFISLMFLTCGFITVSFFSFLNVHSLFVVFAKLDFKTKGYTISDTSLEKMIGKSSSIAFFVVGLFLSDKLFSVHSFLLLILSVGIALIVTFLGSFLVAVSSIFTFEPTSTKMEETTEEKAHENTSFKEEVKENEEEVETTKERMFVPDCFLEKWDGIQSLVSELNQKDLDDIESTHQLNSDILRLEKALELFGNLTKENQEKTSVVIDKMFEQVKENLQNALNRVDEKIILEIQKQQSLLNK